MSVSGVINWTFQGGKKIIQKGTGIAGTVVTTLTVPTGKKWVLLNARLVVTTDATVTNRIPRIRKDDVANDTIINILATTQTASLGPISYYWTQNVSATGVIVNALGLQFAEENEDVILYLANGQAGDSYDYYLEYLEVDV